MDASPTIADQPGVTRVEAPGRYGAPRGSRLVSALLALAMCALLLLALLSMAVLNDQAHTARGILTALNLGPPPGEKQPSPTKAQTLAPRTATTHPTQNAAVPRRLPQIDVNNPRKVEWPEGFIHTSHADMAAGDISTIHSSASTGNANASTGGGGHGGGEGPGGSSFYNVDWYRKPPRTVFDAYMRPGQATGRLAEIECRMVENYHVEDCHELREVPRGTGMARIMREAAWQFLVRPPRLNGKPLLGTRVRITYTFTEAERDAPDDRTGESP